MTANKALIASYLPELQALLQSNPSVKFLYEAAVCGGIPIIHTLHTDFLGINTYIMGLLLNINLELIIYTHNVYYYSRHYSISFIIILSIYIIL